MPKVFIYLQKLSSNSNNMKYWLFPGNKNRFRLDDFINDYGFIEWNPLRYRNHIQVGDIVFIYVGAPSKRICYQMSVEKVNIPFNEWFDDRSYKIPPSNIWGATPDQRMVRLKLIKKINSPFLTFQFLNENGLSGANWIREIKDENLLNYILKHV